MKSLILFLAIQTMMMVMVIASQLITKNAITIHITEPHESTVLYKEEALNVVWASEAPSNMGLIQIKLMHGSPKALETVIILATNVDANLLHKIVKVPNDVPAGNNYALAIGSDIQAMAYLGNLTVADSPTVSKYLSNDTRSTAVSTNPIGELPMRLHNGRKIISLASHTSARPKPLPNLLLLTAFIKMIIM